jgi:PAS domain S-box-containing protein
MTTLDRDSRQGNVLVGILRGEGLLVAPWVRYLLAVALSIFALGVRYTLLRVDTGFVFFTFYPTVTLCAFLLGAGPGLLTLGLCTISAEYFLMPPLQWQHLAPGQILPPAAFVLTGGIICWLAHLVHRSCQLSRDNEQKLRALFETSQVGIVLQDMTGAYLEFNEAFRRICGYPANELRALNNAQLTPEEFTLDDARELESMKRTGYFGPYEKEYLCKDGSRVPLQLYGMKFKSLDGQPRLWAIVEDITERRKGLAALANREERLRGIFTAMAEGLICYARDGRIIDANPAAERILSRGRDQLLGRTSMDPDFQFIREDGTPFPRHEHPATVTLRTGQPTGNQIMAVEPPNGALRWISINSQPIFAANEAEPDCVVMTLRDITERRRLTADLQVARADLQAILDSVPGRITAWHADWTNRFMNRAAEAQFGISAEEAAGKHARVIIGEERYRRAQPHIAAALTGARQWYEQIDVQPDGSRRYSHVMHVPQYRDGRIVAFYTLGTDVTELRESHRQIRELAQRFETVREDERRSVAQLLHEGIAQELFAMKLGLDQLQAEAAGRAGVAQACRELAGAIDKCLGDTRHLANDLRPSAIAHLRLSIALQAHARYFGEISGLRINVTEIAPFPDLNEALRLIFFRAAQEALTNAARHAQASKVDILLRADADCVAMDIADDGVGIEDKALAKAGSLGLLGIRERFGAHGGSLAVRRNTPAGTTVSVRIPHAAIRGG